MTVGSGTLPDPTVIIALNHFVWGRVLTLPHGAYVKLQFTIFDRIFLKLSVNRSETVDR